MVEYDVTVEVSGYCRGMKTFRVEANSEEEAKSNWSEGKLIEDSIQRDDREMNDIVNCDEVKQK